MAISNTSICNQAFGRIGAKRINDIDDDTDTKPEAIQARLHFEPTRDALTRSHWWRFASDRATLARDPETPDFEWDYQFLLPNDFLAMKSIYEDRYSNENLRSYALEGTMLLTDEDAISIRYIKKVTDPTRFDPLFIEVLVLQLADKFIGPLAGGDKGIQEKIDKALAKLMPAVKALDRQETNTEGQYSLETWNDARYT